MGPGELASREVIHAGCRRDGLKAVFVVTAVYNADELNQEWVEAKLVVATVGRYKRDRRCRSWRDASRLRYEGTHFIPQLKENFLILRYLTSDFIPEGYLACRVQHSSDSILELRVA
jgi:hypothetical protein